MKVMPHNKIATKIKGRIKRNKEIPADLIATNSKVSPRLPKVIMEEIRIAMGMAKGSSEALAYHKNSPIVKRSRSLPTRSSIYFQRVCITKTKNVMKNVATNGPIKDLMISLSNFLIIPKSLWSEAFNKLFVP